MNACKSDCDCYPFVDPETGGEVHESDCHSRVECDDGRWCDRHFQEELTEHLPLKGVSRHQIFNDQQAIDERNQELRDAGRGHLAGDIE